MDYRDIVLSGFADKNSRKHLSGYFKRELGKAEKADYSRAEFFDGCEGVISSFEDYLMKEVYQRKRDIEARIREAKKGTLVYGDEANGRTIEQRHKNTIEQGEKELSSISKSNFTITLWLFTNGQYKGTLYNDDVLEIKLALNQAKEPRKLSTTKSEQILKSEKLSLKKKEDPNDQGDGPLEPLKHLFKNKTEYQDILSILAMKGLIHPETYIWIDHTGGFKVTAAGIIIDLHSKSYFIGNVRPKLSEIVRICRAVFGLELSLGTAKAAAKSKVTFDYIPVSSSK